MKHLFATLFALGIFASAAHAQTTAAKFELVALIEGELVILEGRSPADLLRTCTRDSARFQNVDNILMTLNGDRYVSLYNAASYWNGVEVCHAMLVGQGTRNTDAAPVFIVEGNIEDRPFTLEGTRGDMLQQCLVDLKDLGDVDDIVVSVNERPLRWERNENGYWKTAQELCGYLAAVIDVEADDQK